MPVSSLVFALVVMVAAEVGSGWALTEGEQAQIVQKHNAYRSGVAPAASDMLKMKWDTTLEKMAIEYAKKCTWAHNPDRGRIGENLFLTTFRTLNVEQAVEDWYKEIQHYDFDANTCAEDQMCGHYTQVVWASTYKVGCGAHFCEKLEGIDETNANVLVCNYEPPGNIQGRKPYTPGTPCSLCSASYSCVNNLCEQIVGLEDTTSEFLASGDSLPIEWPSTPSISEPVSIDFDATISSSLTDKETLPSNWPPTPWLTSTSNIDISTEELSRLHLTTEEAISLSSTQSHSPISSKDVEEHQATSIRMETDRVRVSDLTSEETISLSPTQFHSAISSKDLEEHQTASITMETDSIRVLELTTEETISRSPTQFHSSISSKDLEEHQTASITMETDSFRVLELTTEETVSLSMTQSHSPISSKDLEEHQATSITMETDSVRVSDLTTEETVSLSPTQSNSSISSNDVEEHQGTSITMETDSFRVLDLSTSFTTSPVVKIYLEENSVPLILLAQETTPRRTDAIEGSSPEYFRVTDLAYLSGITEQIIDLEVTTSDFPTKETILPTMWPSMSDLRSTSADIDSEVTTSSSRTRKDIISTNEPSTPDLKTSENVDTTQEQVTTLHISTLETMPPPQTTPQSLTTSTEAKLDQKETLAPYKTTNAVAALRSHSSTTVRTSPRVKINQDQNRQQPIRSDKATSPGRTHALNVPSSDNSNGHSQMYQSDDAGRRSTDLYWSTSCCGVRKGLCVLPLYREEGGSVDPNCLQRTVVKPQLCSRSWGNGCCGGKKVRSAVHSGAQWAVNQPWSRYFGQTLPRYGGVRWHMGGKRSHRIYREVHEQPCLGAQAGGNKTGCYTRKDSEALPTPALLVEESNGSSSQQPGSIALLTVFVFIWFCLN